MAQVVLLCLSDLSFLYQSNRLNMQIQSLPFPIKTST